MPLAASQHSRGSILPIVSRRCNQLWGPQSGEYSGGATSFNIDDIFANFLVPWPRLKAAAHALLPPMPSPALDLPPSNLPTQLSHLTIKLTSAGGVSLATHLIRASPPAHEAVRRWPARTESDARFVKPYSDRSANNVCNLTPLTKVESLSVSTDNATSPVRLFSTLRAIPSLREISVYLQKQLELPSASLLDSLSAASPHLRQATFALATSAPCLETWTALEHDAVMVGLKRLEFTSR